MELPGRIKLLLSTGGLTERELADLSGLSPQAINFLGSGSRDNPTLKTLRAISRVFDVSIDWLANGDEESLDKSAVVAAVARARAAHGQEHAA